VKLSDQFLEQDATPSHAKDVKLNVSLAATSLSRLRSTNTDSPGLSSQSILPVPRKTRDGSGESFGSDALYGPLLILPFTSWIVREPETDAD